MKRCLSFVLIFLLIISCKSKSNSANPNANDSLSILDYQKDPITRTLKRYSLNNSLDIDILEERQDYYYSIIYPKVYSKISPNFILILKSLITSMIEDYKMELSSLEDIVASPFFNKADSNPQNKQSISLEKYSIQGNVESVVLKQSKIRVGSNGFSGFESVNFNIKEDRPLSIDELVKDDIIDENGEISDYQIYFFKRIEDFILKQLKLSFPGFNKNDIIGSLELNGVNFSKFAIDNKFLYIYYSEIELLPHYYGPLKFEIPIDIVSDLLNKDLLGLN